MVETAEEKYGINIISHNKPFKNIKSICWIPDLQHRILKKNFNEKEILQRDKIFENLNFLKFLNF